MPRPPPNKPDKLLVIPDDRKLLIGFDPATNAATQAWDVDDPDAPKTSAANVSNLEFVKDFFWTAILNDPAWGRTLESLYMGMTVRGLFYKKRATDAIRLTSEQYDAICEIVRKPSRPYSPVVMSHLPMWFEAILQAPDAPPKPDEPA